MRYKVVGDGRSIGFDWECCENDAEVVVGCK